ncbi:UNVERIFIED_ORG: hypothetical protein J2X79_004649 [Arthrobacter globiformis]|nr:hypothetical protein [Arthrobacter globiformis]
MRCEAGKQDVQVLVQFDRPVIIARTGPPRRGGETPAGHTVQPQTKQRLIFLRIDEDFLQFIEDSPQRDLYFLGA